MNLFQRFHVGKDPAAHFRQGLAFELGRWLAIDPICHRAQPRSDLFDQLVVAKITGRRYDHAARAIARLEEVEKVSPLKACNGLFPAANGATDGMTLEEIEI